VSTDRGHVVFWNAMVSVIDTTGPLIAGLPPEREALKLAGQFRHTRLTLLCGGSDASRGRFIEGVLPVLGRRARDRSLKLTGPGAGGASLDRRAGARGCGASTEIVTVQDDWTGCPLSALQKRIHESVARAGLSTTSVSLPMANSLGAWSRLLDARFLIILARFDEFLEIPVECSDRRRFTHEVNQMLDQAELPVNFLICMREPPDPDERWGCDPIAGVDIAPRIRLYEDGQARRPRTLSDLTLREMIDAPDAPLAVLCGALPPAAYPPPRAASRLVHAVLACATVAAFACACWLASGVDSHPGAGQAITGLTVSSNANPHPN
jgi:hypothetical protein